MAPVQSLLEEGVKLSHELGDKVGEPYAMQRLCIALLLRGQHETDQQSAQSSVQLAREIGELALLFGALMSLGWVFHNSEQHA